MKGTLGFVHLAGRLSCPAGTNTAFTLPTGYRPASRLVFAMAVSNGASNMEVIPDGSVRYFNNAGAATNCSIDGITFPGG